MMELLRKWIYWYLADIKKEEWKAIPAQVFIDRAGIFFSKI